MASDAMEIGRRIQQIRGQMTLPAFADLVGISRSSLVRYEKGDRFPDSAILTTLCETLSVNGHWLLTGQGPVRSTAADAVAAADARRPSLPPVATNYDLRVAEQSGLLRDAGLAEALLLARRGTQASLWHILRLLNADPGRARTVAELDGLMGESDPPRDPRDIAADCRLLVLEGLAEEEVRRGDKAYRVKPGARLTPGQHVDRLQAVREAIRLLGDDVLPALQRRDGDGYLAQVELYLPAGGGARLMEELRALLSRKVNDLADDGGERARMLIAVAVERE